MTEQQCPKCGRATIQMTPDGRRRCSASPNLCAWTGQGEVGPSRHSLNLMAVHEEHNIATLMLGHDLQSGAITGEEFSEHWRKIPGMGERPLFGERPFVAPSYLLPKDAEVSLVLPQTLEHVTTVVRFDGQAVPLTCGAENMHGSCHLERGHDGPHKCRDNATVGGVWKWYGNPIQKCQSTWRGKPCALVNGHPGSHHDQLNPGLEGSCWTDKGQDAAAVVPDGAKVTHLGGEPVKPHGDHEDQARRHRERERELSICGAHSGVNLCNREPGHTGDHREDRFGGGYMAWAQKPLRCESPDCAETHPTMMEGDVDGEGWVCSRGHEGKCEATTDRPDASWGWVCTRPKGHVGNHAAWDVTSGEAGELRRLWPQEPEPAEKLTLTIPEMERYGTQHLLVVDTKGQTWGHLPVKEMGDGTHTILVSSSVLGKPQVVHLGKSVRVVELTCDDDGGWTVTPAPVEPLHSVLYHAILAEEPSFVDRLQVEGQVSGYLRVHLHDKTEPVHEDALATPALVKAAAREAVRALTEEPLTVADQSGRALPPIIGRLETATGEELARLVSWHDDSISLLVPATARHEVRAYIEGVLSHENRNNPDSKRFRFSSGAMYYRQAWDQWRLRNATDTGWEDEA